MEAITTIHLFKVKWLTILENIFKIKFLTCLQEADFDSLIVILVYCTPSIRGMEETFICYYPIIRMEDLERDGGVCGKKIIICNANK